MVCFALEVVGPWVVLGFSVCMEATVRLRLKTRGRRLKSKTLEHQRTPDSREH